MFHPHPRKFDWKAAKHKVQKLTACNLKPSPEHTCSLYIIMDWEMLLKQEPHFITDIALQIIKNYHFSSKHEWKYARNTYKLLASWLGTAKHDQILAKFYFYSFLQTLNPESPGLLTSFFPQWIVIFSASLLKIQSFRGTEKCKHRHRTWSSTFILTLTMFSCGFIDFVCCQIKWSAGQGVYSI